MLLIIMSYVTRKANDLTLSTKHMMESELLTQLCHNRKLKLEGVLYSVEKIM